MRDGWVATPLSEVVEHTIGGVWGGESDTDEVEVTVVRSTEFTKRGFLNFETGVPRSIKSSQLKSRELLPGDILLEKSGGGPDQPVGRVVFVAEAIPKKFVCSNFVQLVRPNSKQIEPLFLFHIMWQWHALNRTLEFQAQTTGIRNLRTPDYLEQEINLPPLPEQKRIVDLISSVDSYIEALQQQLKSGKRSRNAVLHELLTAGGDNWIETTLGEVAHLNSEQARDYESDRLIKYIDLSTVTFDTGISTEIEQLPFNEAPGRARRIIREKDVIVSTVRPYLKGFAFVGREFDGQIASTGFCVIRAKSESILSELIWALVGSDDFVDFLIRRSTGSNYPAVRPNDISDFTFMLPPLHDQETVSKLITTFDDAIRASTVLIDSAQNLRSGLLSDLLSGEHEIPASYDKVIGAA